jgi:hypothetical protein
LLSTNHRHAATGTHKALVTNEVFEFFVPHGPAKRRGKCLIITTRADNCTQIRFDGCKEAGPKLTVCGETDTVASGTKRFTHWIDKANLANPVLEGIATGCVAKTMVLWYPLLYSRTAEEFPS